MKRRWRKLLLPNDTASTVGLRQMEKRYSKIVAAVFTKLGMRKGGCYTKE
jgi:hypothetical protein